MNCWSWPSWHCTAGGPWGHMGQACKLDAVLLLSWQGSFFFFFAIQPQKQRSHVSNHLPLSPAGPTSAKTRARERERESKGGAPWQTVTRLSFISHSHLPSLPSSANRQPPTPPCQHRHTHTLSVIALPRLPQCLFHYWLQCFSAPQPYAQHWWLPVTQHHTN